jgi:hypothetical protein
MDLGPAKRPSNLIGNAVHVMKVLTGEIEEDVKQPSVAAEMGRRGGKARAESMTPERRAEIASIAAKACYFRGD